MTTFNPAALVPKFINSTNTENNDYRYYSGWSRQPVLLGQQYKFWKNEAQALVKEIDQKAFFQDPMLPCAPRMDARKHVLQALHELTTREASQSMSKGSVALSRGAAAVLNDYAKSLGLDLQFRSGQPRPLHPVG